MAIFTLSHDAAQIMTVLNVVVGRSQDMSPFWREFSQNLVTSTQERFESSIAPGGSRWATLAKSTLRRKQKRKRDKILVDDGHLRNTITYRLIPGGAEIGSPMIYARAHQFGAQIERHAQSSINPAMDRFLRFRKIKVKREDGSSFDRLVLAKKSHKSVVAMARRWTGAAVTTIPARPFLGLSDQDREMMVVTAGRYFGVA